MWPLSMFIYCSSNLLHWINIFRLVREKFLSKTFFFLPMSITSNSSNSNKKTERDREYVKISHIWNHSHWYDCLLTCRDIWIEEIFSHRIHTFNSHILHKKIETTKRFSFFFLSLKVFSFFLFSSLSFSSFSRGNTAYINS